MKSIANKLLFLSMAGAICMGGSGMRMPYYEEKRNKVPEKLFDFKHYGDIPKGCKLENITLSFKKDIYTLQIKVDLVYGTEKGRSKKIGLYTRQIQNYINSLSTEEILKRNEFTVLENNQ